MRAGIVVKDLARNNLGSAKFNQKLQLGSCLVPLLLNGLKNEIFLRGTFFSSFPPRIHVLSCSGTHTNISRQFQTSFLARRVMEYANFVNKNGCMRKFPQTSPKLGRQKKVLSVKCSNSLTRMWEKRARVLRRGVVAVRKNESYSIEHHSAIEFASPAPPLLKSHRVRTSTMADDDEESRLFPHVTYHMPSSPPPPLPPLIRPLSTMLTVLPSLFSPVRPAVGRSQHHSSSPSRAWSREPNYSASDVEVLLDTVRDILPREAYEWTTVARRFNNKSSAAGTYRDQDVRKKKFDKLAIVKKSTAEPLCPPEVRAAKNIARDIVGRANAAIFGYTLEEDAQ